MALPSNIKKWLRVNGTEEQKNAAAAVSRWCDKLGHSIGGGTAIGKYYGGLVLDLTFQGGEIYIPEEGTITINNVKIPNTSASSFQLFSKEVEKIFGQKKAAVSTAVIAKELLKVVASLVSSQVLEDFRNALRKEGVSIHGKFGCDTGIRDKGEYYELYVMDRGSFSTGVLNTMKKKYPSIRFGERDFMATNYIIDKK